MPPRSRKRKVQVDTDQGNAEVSTKVTHEDSDGVPYIGNAEVSVSISMKPSINFNSAGVQVGMKFTTPSETVDSAIKAAHKKCLGHVKDIVEDLSERLSEM